MRNGIYLDIDMDFFTEPIYKASVDNIRLYHDKEGSCMSVAPLVDKLKQKGLSWEGSKISCFTNHKVSYTHWWIAKRSNNLLIHIDAHSDLYRNRNKDLGQLHNGDLGCYNYIWYAIRDGYVDEVYWVIPDSMKELLIEEKATEIISNDLIKKVWKNEEGLHIQMECIVITGEPKHIPVHICTMEQLPQFDAFCTKVTIATSPEFMSAACDELIFELLESFEAPKELAHNIYKQHKDMLSKTPEELQSAWEKLNK